MAARDSREKKKRLPWTYVAALAFYFAFVHVRALEYAIPLIPRPAFAREAPDRVRAGRKILVSRAEFEPSAKSGQSLSQQSNQGRV